MLPIKTILILASSLSAAIGSQEFDHDIKFERHYHRQLENNPNSARDVNPRQGSWSRILMYADEGEARSTPNGPRKGHEQLKSVLGGENYKNHSDQRRETPISPIASAPSHDQDTVEKPYHPRRNATDKIMYTQEVDQLLQDNQKLPIDRLAELFHTSISFSKEQLDPTVWAVDFIDRMRQALRHAEDHQETEGEKKIVALIEAMLQNHIYHQYLSVQLRSLIEVLKSQKRIGKLVRYIPRFCQYIYGKNHLLLNLGEISIPEVCASCKNVMSTNSSRACS